jgi:hypothetical protein
MGRCPADGDAPLRAAANSLKRDCYSFTTFEATSRSTVL